MGRASDEVNDVGPVDFLVVEFARGRSTFSGEVAAELSRLAEEGLIRVLDLLVIQKAFDGSVEGFEVQDVGCDEIGSLESDLVELLSADDVARISAAMEPGSVAGVVVWENLWAVPFASVARRAGGQLIATGRIPIQAIAASVEADADADADADEGTADSPLGPERGTRRGVVAAPVPRATTTASASVDIARGLDRRQGRRAVASGRGRSPALTHRQQ